MIDAGKAEPDAPGPRTGGLPLVPAGFSWPACSTCGSPMQFVGQFDLPHGRADEPALLSVFMCNHDPGGCQTWSPTSGANQAHVFTGPLYPLTEPATADPDDDVVLDARAVRLVEVDTSDEVPEYDFDVAYDLAKQAWRREHPERGEDLLGQLGGEPAWIQYPEVPACPSCAQPMPLAAQLAESGANFGTGDAYAFACPGCRTAVFLWQC